MHATGEGQKQGPGQGLGDLIHAALATVGVTEARAARLLAIVSAGRLTACGCKGRKDQLNALGAWAKRIMAGRTHGAIEHLHAVVGDETAKEA